jgi:hypothetical protein
MYILQFPKWGRKKRIWDLRKVKVIASLVALKQLRVIADLKVTWSALLRKSYEERNLHYIIFSMDLKDIK